MTIAHCQDCVTAAWVLRRIGFRDNIAWGTYAESPNTPLLHATTSNSRPRDPAPKEQRPGPTVHQNPVPLCTHHRSELAWLSAGKPRRLSVYMAHPVAGDFKENVVSATAWLRWLRSRTPSQLAEITGVTFNLRPLIHAPWLAGIEDIDGDSPSREWVMRDNLDTVALYDEVWMMVRVSSGMKDEAAVARVARDLTNLGPLPPGSRFSAKPKVRKPEKRR